MRRLEQRNCETDLLYDIYKEKRNMYNKLIDGTNSIIPTKTKVSRPVGRKSESRSSTSGNYLFFFDNTCF